MHPSGIIKVQKWNLLKAAPETAFVMYNEMLLWTPLNSTKKKKIETLLGVYWGKNFYRQNVWFEIYSLIQWCGHQTGKRPLFKYSQASRSLQQERKNNFILYMVYIYSYDCLLTNFFRLTAMKLPTCWPSSTIWNGTSTSFMTVMFVSTVTHNFFMHHLYVLQYMSKLKE